jgi:OTU-like cysteine protease
MRVLLPLGSRRTNNSDSESSVCDCSSSSDSSSNTNGENGSGGCQGDEEEESCSCSSGGEDFSSESDQEEEGQEVKYSLAVDCCKPGTAPIVASVVAFEVRNRSTITLATATRRGEGNSYSFAEDRSRPVYSITTAKIDTASARTETKDLLEAAAPLVPTFRGRKRLEVAVSHEVKTARDVNRSAGSIRKAAISLGSSDQNLRSRKRGSGSPSSRQTDFQVDARSANQPEPSDNLAAKRPRPSTEPIIDLYTEQSTMAVGPLRKECGDERRESPVDDFWNQPVENDPPAFQNHPVLLPAMNPDNPADDEAEELCVTSTRVASSAPKARKDIGVRGQYQAALQKHGLEMVEQEGDGNCLFRAVSLQVYGNADNHAEVRERCMDFMARNEEHYSSFVAIASEDEDEAVASARVDSTYAFQAYLARKRKDGVHGNHAEIQAISELFNRPVEVYTPESFTKERGKKPMNIFHEEYKTSDPPIRLSYHDGNHYNAIIDPLVPTAGLGLGLPGLKPGLADQMQVTKAKAESDELADQMEFERVLKESQQEIQHAEEDELQRVLKESTRDFVCE